MKNAKKHASLFIVFAAAAGLACGLLGIGGPRLAVQTAVSQRQLPIYSVDTPQKTVALGINCAWDDQDMDTILQTLCDKQVKATFFLVGSFCRQCPEAVRKIAQAGHELASHSNTHPDMTKLTREQIAGQLSDSRAAIEQAGGGRVRLFRAPSGAYNDLVVGTARELGWEVVQWDNDTLDWKGGEAPELVANGTKRLQNGSIILLHAGAKHTAEALPALIDAVRGAGYEFSPVGDMLLEQPCEIDHTGRQHPVKAADKN